MTDSGNNIVVEIAAEFAGKRVDKALADCLEGHTRGAVQRWFKDGRVLVDGVAVKAKFALSGGEVVTISVPESAATMDDEAHPAQAMEFAIVYRDEEILVVNKPPGMVVHPGAGRADRTLLNGLLHHDETLRALPRAGIVHRLDKDTSGLLVVARTEASRQNLIAQLESRAVKRRYLAVVCGVPVAGETIDQPIARHRHDRLRMSVVASGKSAITHIRVAQKFRAHSLLRAELETGRTHQIRVHLSWRGMPIVGDKLYGGRAKLPRGASEELIHALQTFPRQALHATHLSLRHPRSDEWQSWDAPMPDDMTKLISELETDLRQSNVD